MLRIPLSGLNGQGKFAIVDDDQSSLMSYVWYLSRYGYAVRSYRRRTLFMHREINRTPAGLVTDHINRDKLDNRRANLRSVTNSQNGVNSGPRPNNKCGHVGVHWRAERGRWRAVIRINRRNRYLGSFRTIEEAIEARRQAEIEYLHEGSITAMREGGYA